MEKIVIKRQVMQVKITMKVLGAIIAALVITACTQARNPTLMETYALP